MISVAKKHFSGINSGDCSDVVDGDLRIICKKPRKLGVGRVKNIPSQAASFDSQRCEKGAV